MKYFIFSFCLLSFLISFGCSDNNITEVGNPSTTATSSNGTTSALTNTVDSLIGSFSEPALSKERVLTQEGEEEDFECTFDESEDDSINTFTCSCPNGGTITESFEENFSTETDDLFTFDSSFTTVFESCATTACDEEVTLDGQSQGSISGTFNPFTEEADITVLYGTDQPCSGLTSNGSSVGFEMTVLSDGTTETVSGTFCIENQSFDFDSLEELQEIVDPENVCEFSDDEEFDDEEFDDEEETTGSEDHPMEE